MTFSAVTLGRAAFNQFKLGRVKRQPRHAAKRAQRRLLRIPKLSVKAALNLWMGTFLKAPFTMSSSLLGRWKHRRDTLSLEGRRARALVGGAIVLASLVLLTSFPVAGLISQHSAISGTAHEITVLQTENDALARQAADLADPATVNGLARRDYGFVRLGQRAYQILPSSGSAGTGGSASSGQVPLNEPPVVPGSARSQALVGIVAPKGDTAHSPATKSAESGNLGGPSTGGGPGNSGNAEPRGYWARVVRSLEFWN